MSTQLILLERVEKLGNMGDLVSVKPGYARNFLLPQKKALRASKENIAYFEAKKKHLEADNAKAKTEAEKLAKKLDGLKVPLIRQASESGQLYGSVNSRDIAEQAAATSKEAITRSMVNINQNFKMIGLFPVDVVLHPEVTAVITVNIARSPEEAEIQAESGRALLADNSYDDEPEAAPKMDAEAALEDVLEADALEAEKEKLEQKELSAKEKEEADKVKSEARAAKKAAKAEEEASEETAKDGEEASDVDASEEE
jgi:large subunit ribosomal protein L9